MYLSTAYNRVAALDAETGKEIWVKDVGHMISTRGIAYWPGGGGYRPRLVFGTTDQAALLIALDAKTGAYAEGFGQGGRVDLRQGIGEKFPKLRVALSSPPAIYRDLAITGQHSQEAPSLGPSGDVRAWDMRTGRLVWTFHTIPRPGEPHHEVWKDGQWADRAGANAWGFITVDGERGVAYVPTGTPATDFYGGDRLGSNLYGSSLLALDAATGKLKWFFQTTHHDNWDYDLQAPPALINVRRNGRTIPAVAQYSKQGLLFIFDRVTGEPIFGVEERPVISDNPLPGDEYSPTQPFPVKPPPIARMTFSPTEVARVTPEHERFCRSLLELEGGAMTGGPYAQYGPRLRVIFPGWTGGGNWDGTAFNPDLGYLFFPSQNLGMLNKMVKSTTSENMYVRSGPDNAPPRLGTNFWDGAKGWPCQQPPWGELIAVNVNTGDVAWRVPLGSFEELDALGVAPTGTPHRGGPIATAGGLVFIGASQDARFRAFDARTGKALWAADLTENGRAVPITYQGRSGRQYVAIMAGGGIPVARKVDESLIGGRLHVYALPDGRR
jgi:quinoprotein glucose dehydrogenase